LSNLAFGSLVSNGMSITLSSIDRVSRSDGDIEGEQTYRLGMSKRHRGGNEEGCRRGSEEGCRRGSEEGCRRGSEKDIDLGVGQNKVKTILSKKA